MVQIPLNYKTVYFFIMSFFALLFFVTLINPMEISHPLFLTITSLINVFLGITAWIFDEKYDREFETERTGLYPTKAQIQKRDSKKRWNLIGVTVTTFVFSLIGILPQFVQYFNN